MKEVRAINYVPVGALIQYEGTVWHALGYVEKDKLPAVVLGECAGTIDDPDKWFTEDFKPRIVTVPLWAVAGGT